MTHDVTQIAHDVTQIATNDEIDMMVTTTAAATAAGSGDDAAGLLHGWELKRRQQRV